VTYPVKQPFKKIVFLATTGILLIVAFALQLYAEDTDRAGKVQNVILMIGDGMGLAHITATRIHYQGANGTLNIDRMPYTGFARTHSDDDLVTDSAASSTALSTGFKTHNGMIGVTPDTMKVLTIVEACQRMGMASGLVVTCEVTHATPAGMAAHVVSRKQQDLIAEQYLNRRVNVILGGGLVYFLPESQPQSKRKDEKDLIRLAVSEGYEFVDTRDALQKAKSKYVLGLFAPEALCDKPEEPSLEEMTKTALRLLGKEPKGFFLMVEGSQIDWRAHNNDENGVYEQTEQFDEAVGAAMDFVARDKHTLLVITADHETGGMAITSGKVRSKEMSINWISTRHTGVMVPVYAYGPGSDRFTGTFDDTQIPIRIASLLGIRDFPKITGALEKPNRPTIEQRTPAE
jgi:alkaline phosphatase